MSSPLQTSSIISVREARKLLGHDAKPMSDAELLEYIDRLDGIAKVIVRARLVPKS